MKSAHCALFNDSVKPIEVSHFHKRSVIIILFVVQEIREIGLPNRVENCLKTVLDSIIFWQQSRKCFDESAKMNP